MQTNRIGRWFVAMALAAAACGWAGAWAAIAQERDVYVEAGVEVLTRGPVHEAFAETVTFDLDVGVGCRQAFEVF